MAPLDRNVTALLHALRGVPEMTGLLNDRVVGLQVYRALLGADVQFGRGVVAEHDVADCVRVALDTGRVVVKPAWDVFADEVAAAGAASRDEEARFGPDTHYAALLAAFALAGDEGLTDDVAAVSAGVAGSSSPWRRCTSLRSWSLIRALEDGDGDVVRRVGLRGSERMVSVITPDGLSLAAELDLF